jgi:tetratricopeptide (TPR) repeat protein
MKRNCAVFSFFLVLAVSLFSSRALQAQVDRIVIAAGTDEDKELQAITNEQDQQKKLAMYQEFAQKFSTNPAAVAYANWQISQAYQVAGDMPKALDFGDKALAGSPHNLEIVVSQVNIAQQAKDNAKTMDYIAKGGAVCQSISKQAKPDGMSDEDFARKVSDDKASAETSCNFLETSGFNVIAGETDPKARMADIEKYTAGFPDSKFQDQVSNYAMYTLGPGQLNDPTRLVAFGEKTLAANPNSLPALLLLANYYADDPKAGSLAKAVTYSQKVVDVAKADAPDADKSRKMSAGVAHSTLGYALMKQDKTTSAVPELKSATALLKGQDDQQYAVALYRLGFAYAKLNRTTEARDVLNEAVKISGPMQPMSQELLAKVNAARAKGK